MSGIAHNLIDVRKRLIAAAERAKRDPAGIKLVAVSKTKPASLIREAHEAGQRIFGENYAQELAHKAAELADLDIQWHFIGHLQRNKAKLVAPAARCVETVDSLKLAETLNSRAQGPLDVLIEVNIGGEESKAGVAENDIPALARDIARLDRLNLTGLMIIPPYVPDPEASRPYFRKLRQIMTRLNDSNGVGYPLTELSMGMSHDFEAAIEEGATIVRVGTAIFGERDYP